jgi:chromosome segregation ATPase
MDELQSLQHQLEEARDEAELNLLQLQQVQEELEFYFLRCQDLERELADHSAPAAVVEPETSPAPVVPEELTNLQEALATTQARLAELEQQRSAEQQLLRTAQSMLEGQARYLEDVSHREEQAAQALDRLRLLEAEIRYYIRHSKPLASLDPQRINRLIQLAKQPGLSSQVV